MAKALMIWAPGASHASGQEIPIFGTTSTATELQCQASCTEGATFSGLAIRSTGGGSGTNNLFFRKNGANGNQLATRSGFGFAEDSVNTDVLSAGDLFNLAITDTGTSQSGVTFARSNIELTSGHGNIHGAFTIAAFNAASATNYIGLAGDFISDGDVTIANQQWKNRGYTSVEAFQVRVTANARTNDTTFRLNVNGTAVGTAITVSASATGLFSVTGMGQSLASGDLVCLQITTGTGTTVMDVAFVSATFKSTSGKSETWCSNAIQEIRAASATADYLSPGGYIEFSTNYSEANSRVKVGFACTITNLRSYLVSNTYTAAGTVKVFVNGIAQLTLSITASTAGWHENTVDTATIDADDEISFEVLGGTSGSASFSSIGLTFEPSGTAITPVSGEFDHEITSVTVTRVQETTPAEFDHEIQSAAISSDLSADAAEFDHEVTSVSVILVQSVDAAEFDYEIDSAAITQVHVLGAQESEYDHESQSVALGSGGIAIIPVSGEFDFESELAAIQFNKVAQEAEFDHEVSSCGLTQLHNLSIDSAEFGHELESLLLSSNLVPSEAELDVEITSASIIQVHVFDAQDSEYDHESQSAAINADSGGIAITAASGEFGYESESPALQFNLVAHEAEFDHEVSSLILQGVSPANAEFGHEIQGPDFLPPGPPDLPPPPSIGLEMGYEVSNDPISQVHVVAPFQSEYAWKAYADLILDSARPASAEFDHEFQGPEFTPPAPPGLPSLPSIGWEMGWKAGSPFISVHLSPSEYDWESDSAALLQEHNLLTGLEDGFDWETGSPELQDQRYITAQDAEFGFEVFSITELAGFQCNTFQEYAFQNDCRFDYNAEFDWETGSPALIATHSVAPEYSEFGFDIEFDGLEVVTEPMSPMGIQWEAGSAALEPHVLLGVEDSSAKYGWETISVFPRRFVGGMTPTHRRRYVIE